MVANLTEPDIRSTSENDKHVVCQHSRVSPIQGHIFATNVATVGATECVLTETVRGATSGRAHTKMVVDNSRNPHRAEGAWFPTVPVEEDVEYKATMHLP